MESALPEVPVKTEFYLLTISRSDIENSLYIKGLTGRGNMRHPIKKFGTATMAVSLFLCVFPCGCTKKNDKKTAITDEAGLVLSGTMPGSLPEGLSWYDFEESAEVFDQIASKIGEYYVTDIKVHNGRTWAFVDEYNVERPSQHIMSFDKDGLMITDSVIDRESGNDISLESLIAGDRLYLEGYDFSKDSSVLFAVDETTGKAVPDSRISLSEFISRDDYIHSCAFAGDDLALLVIGSSSYCVKTVDINSGNVKKNIDIKDVQKNFNIQYFEGFMAAGSGKVILWGNTSMNMYFGQIRYIVLDLVTGQGRALDEYEFINIPLRNLSSFGGTLVSTTDTGLYKIDLDNGSCELMMSFNLSNCNRFLVNNSELTYFDDDMMVFYYSSRTASAGQLQNALCTFTRSDSYPAADKKILTVASTEDLDYGISEAIMKFNEQSDSSYILFDGRYKANTNIDYSNTDSTDTAALSSLGAYASVSDRLAMDITSGNGPDIIITSGANEQLSNSDYFIDLSEFIKSESGINKDEYFMNVFEASKYNGLLYQLPIGFYVDGFIGTEEYFGGKNGLAFDEYLDMVGSVCNGSDPLCDHQLSYSRTKVATTLFANMNELFIKDGKIDVRNEAFRAILDYCKDLPARSYTEDMDLYTDAEDFYYGADKMPVKPCRVNGFYDFELYAGSHENVTLCGYPSVDGRTASVGSDIALSISAQSEDPASCKEFLKILLSDDIQRTLEINIPVSRKCAKDLFLDEIRSHNSSVDEGYNDSVFAGHSKKIDESLAGRYIDQLSAASTSCFVYNSISMIIYEEIPAYFEGQKSFDDVADTINDRAQTVLNERK